MPDFYHVFLNPGDNSFPPEFLGIKEKEVEERLSLALDWFRYYQNCYVIYTDKDANAWHARLKPLVKDGGRLFICKLDVSQRSGWMDQVFWDWLEKTINLWNYRVGDHVFVWLDREPIRVYEGTVSGFGPSGKPNVSVQGIQLEFTPGAPIVISKVHPLIKKPSQPPSLPFSSLANPKSPWQ